MPGPSADRRLPAIRKARCDDAKQLAAVAEETFRDTFAAVNSPEDMALHCRASYSEEIQAEEIANPNRVTLLYEHGGRLVGFAQLRWGQAPSCVVADAPGEIQRLYVTRDFHGKGIAHDLMKACMDEMTIHRADVAWLGVWERNPRAIAFYRKYGFLEVGAHVFPLGNDPQRDIVMAVATGRAPCHTAPLQGYPCPVARSASNLERALPALACPTHHNALRSSNEQLTCSTGCTYLVRNGIARFVPASNYAAAFGLQWLRYRRTQLDSYTGIPLTARRLRRCIGDDLWAQLRGKAVLEVGCGAGRFTEVLLAQGASVFSTDLSEAVEANQENFPQNQQHQIAQADVYALPFARRQFDIVLCLGVIQHTPSPEKTIAALWEQVAPGGHLVIDHYTYNLSYFTKTAPLFRAVLKRLDPERALRITDGLVRMLLPLHKAARNAYPLQALLSRISPVQAYYHALPELTDELQREWAMLDTHDTLTDWYKHFRSREQIRGLLKSLGAEHVWCEKGGNGVEARACRPGVAAAARSC